MKFIPKILFVKLLQITLQASSSSLHNAESEKASVSSVIEAKAASKSAQELSTDFQEDPFKNYRYEDPFMIEDPFKDENGNPFKDGKGNEKAEIGKKFSF